MALSTSMRPMPRDWMPEKLVINAAHETSAGPVSLAFSYELLADAGKFINDPMVVGLRDAVWQFLEIFRLAEAGDEEAKAELKRISMRRRLGMVRTDGQVS